MKNTHTTAYSKQRPIGKPLRILLLVHEGYLRKGQLIQSDQTKAERATLRALKKLGYQVHVLGISIELYPLVEKIQQWNPDVVFPFLEEFHCSADLDFAPMALLESLQIPFVGSGTEGLILSRHKGLAKQRVGRHGIDAPQAWSEKQKKFPVIVKSASEDASLGLHQNSVCYSETELKTALRRAKKKQLSNLMVEEFIPGREIYVSMMEDGQMFTPWELRLPTADSIASNKVKWNRKYRLKNKITSGPMKNIDDNWMNELKKRSRKIFKSLGLRGYARLDFRMNSEGHLFFLEANANPNLDPTEDFVRSARSSGVTFERLVDSLIRIALKNSRFKYTKNK